MAEELSPQEEREIAVLRAYMETRTYDGAAQAIGITRPAVQSHLHRMRQRYGVTDSTIGLVYALRDRGLLSLEWRV